MLDMLGILIGFVMVVLLLSIIATSLTQMTSSVLRLRGRNLYRSLSRVLQAAFIACGTRADDVNTKVLAEKVCASPMLLEIGRNVLPDSVPQWLRGPSRTWIEREELRRILTAMSEVPDAVVGKVDELFPRLEELSAKRFAFFMRIVSIVWALVIALVFQVSAPDLLRELSADPALRGAAAESLAEINGYPDVAAQALEELAAQHADLAATFKGIETAGPGKAELVGELRDALEARADAADIVNQFAEILDRRYREQIRNSVGALARINIEPWGRGTGFYWTQKDGAGLGLHWRNIGGISLMAILLTLGAPFWFQILSRLSGLRDMLSGADEKGGKGGSSASTGARGS